MESKMLNGFVVSQEVTLCGLRVKPHTPYALACGPEGMERKQFERQYNILRGYACLSRKGLPLAGEVVDLASLEIPETEGSDALAAVWFCRACEEQEGARAAMAVYNGFGALAGGFDRALALARRYMDAACAAVLEALVASAKREENDLAERSSPPAPAVPCTQAELEQMRGGLCRACLDART